MNLNRNPTLEELRQIVARANDQAGEHVLWVDFEGRVFLDNCLPGELGSEYVVGLGGQFKFGLGSLPKGQGWVGSRCAQNAERLNRLYASLIYHHRSNTTGLTDYFVSLPDIQAEVPAPQARVIYMGSPDGPA